MNKSLSNMLDGLADETNTKKEVLIDFLLLEGLKSAGWIDFKK